MPSIESSDKNTSVEKVRFQETSTDGDIVCDDNYFVSNDSLVSDSDLRYDADLLQEEFTRQKQKEGGGRRRQSIQQLKNRRGLIPGTSPFQSVLVTRRQKTSKGNNQQNTEQRWKHGMDFVGDHIVAIQEWIEFVHKTAPGSVNDSWRSEWPFHQRSRRRLRKGVSSTSTFSDRQKDCIVADNIFPLGVTVQHGLEEALDGLSECLLFSRERMEHDEKFEGEMTRIIQTVARIPSLMKTIMLIEDEEDRDAVMVTPIIRRVMFSQFSLISEEDAFDASMRVHPCARSSSTSNKFNVTQVTKSFVRASWHKREAHEIEVEFRSWLLEMIKTGNRLLTDMAIDYLEMISDLGVEHYLVVKTPKTDENFEINQHVMQQYATEEEVEFFMAEKGELFKTICKLRKLIPLLFGLRNCDKERASVTTAVRFCLEDALLSPFSIYVIFFDFFHHVIMIVLYRRLIATSIDRVQGFERDINVKDYIVSASIIYFFLRLFGECIAMLTISWRVFFVNFFSSWNLIHVSSIVLVVVTSLWPRDNYDDSYFAATSIGILLLWLNLVGFLRVLNEKLATFVLAISQIAVDIRQFLLLMIILIIGFGDAIHTLVASSEKECPENFNSDITEVSSPFCKGERSSLFTVFRVLVGDNSADEFGSKDLSRIFYTGFTFAGIVIFLNILISIVDDSYVRSTFMSARLFGRARITLVAKISALEDLLHPSPLDIRNMQWKDDLPKVMVKVAFLGGTCHFNFLCYLCLLSLKEALEEKYGFRHSDAVLVVVAIFFPILLVQLILFSYLFTGWKKHTPGRFKDMCRRIQEAKCRDLVLFCPLHYSVKYMLGIGSASEFRNLWQDERWFGRLQHVEAEVRRVVSQAENQTKQNMVVLESRIKENEVQRKHANGEMKQRLDCLERERRIEMEGLERRLAARHQMHLEEMERRLMESFAKTLSKCDDDYGDS